MPDINDADIGPPCGNRGVVLLYFYSQQIKNNLNWLSSPRIKNLPAPTLDLLLKYAV
jgi:hypothetical protein